VHGSILQYRPANSQQQPIPLKWPRAKTEEKNKQTKKSLAICTT